MNQALTKLPQLLSAGLLALLLVACGGGGNSSPANVAPLAAFTAPASADINTPVSFDASGSSDSDGSIQTYAWDFGDGGSATGVNAQHSYGSVGSKTIVLTVTDNDGASTSISRSIEINPASAPVDNLAPVAAFTAPASADINTPVSFDASGSSDSDGSIQTYAWDFGDGGSATGVNAQHTFASGGSKTVVLTVTDDDGVSTSVSRSIDINVAPVAAFTAPNSAEINTPVSFDASGSSDSDGSIQTYAWDFGDGGSATGVNAQHSYGSVGSKTVTLTVTDNDGAITILTRNIKVATDVTRILPIGDSITEGYSRTEPAIYPSYRYPLWKNLLEENKSFDMLGRENRIAHSANPITRVTCDTSVCPDFEGFAFDPDHSAYSGATVSDVRQQVGFWTPATNQEPDIALIHLGTNNILQLSFSGKTIEDARDDMRGLITDLNSRFPLIKIYLAQIIPIAYNEPRPTQVANYNNLLLNLESEFTNVTLVDQFSAINSPGSDLYDQVHPSNSGEEKMADAWFNAIKDEVF